MVWALLIIPLVVALLIGYIISRSMLGQEAAWRNLLATSLLLLLTFAVVFALLSLPQPGRDYALSGLFIVCSVIPWLVILTWPRRKRLAGYLLWNLGWPSTHRYMLVASAIFLINEILQTIVFVSLAVKGFSGSYSIPEYYLSQVILYWSVTICLFWVGFSKLELRENGIYYKFGFIKWEQIASYKWEGTKANTLTIWLKQRFPVFQTRSWPIPLALKNPVERLIDQQMSGKKGSTKFP